MALCKYVRVTRGKKQSFTIFKNLPSPREKFAVMSLFPCLHTLHEIKRSPVKNRFLNRCVSANTTLVALVVQESVTG